MAKLKFLGIAQAVSQVTEITLGGTWSAGETARIIINGKFIEYTVVTSDTPALVAAGLKALAAASSIAEFREITWTVATTKVTATGTAGEPFTLTVAEGSASGTISGSDTINATGPYHWDNTGNWSTGSVPVNSDEVFVESAVEIRYGFPTGLTLAKFVQSAGAVGLPDVNVNGYNEYRPTYLTVSAAIVSITGGTRSRVSTESVTTVVTAQNRSGTVDLKVNHSGASIHALSGSVRVVPSDAETGQASVIRCNPEARLEVGAGFTVATVLSAGQSTLRCAITTLTVEDGLCLLRGSATTVNVAGGTCSYETASTITTLNLSDTGLLECRNDVRAKTITTFNMNGGRLSNPYRVLTFTNGIQPGVDLLQAG